VSITTGALAQAFEWQYPSWFPLLVAVLIVVLVDIAVQTRTRKRGWFTVDRPVLWLLNSCLVFVTAVGGTRLMTPQEEAGTDEAPAPVEVAMTEESERVAVEQPPAPAPAEQRPVATEPSPEPARKPVHVIVPFVTVPSTPPPPAAPELGAGESGSAASTTRVAISNTTRTKMTPARARPLIRPRPVSTGFRRLGDMSLF
jgi:hypothetical protein